MTRVLMGTNDQTFAPAYTHAYHARGLDVAAGVPNLDPAFGRADVVHLHWPEELVGWGTNTRDPRKTARILKLLDWWKERAVLVATIHNLVPHNADRLDGPEADFFRAFYERIDLICHYTDYSRARYGEVYPMLDPAKQIVHPTNSFDHLRPLAKGREAARRALGVSGDAPVFALCGALRKQDELALVQSAWKLFGRKDARLLMASRASWQGSLPRQLRGKILHRLWRRDPRITMLPPNPDDEALVQILEAADALLIPRLGHHLNSGLVPLALTFGTAVIAPDNGPNAEVVPLPANELYAPGDPAAFAQAMNRQAAKSAADVIAANLAHGETIGVTRILETIWPRIQQAGRAKGLAAFS